MNWIAVAIVIGVASFMLSIVTTADNNDRVALILFVIAVICFTLAAGFGVK